MAEKLTFMVEVPAFSGNVESREIIVLVDDVLQQVTPVNGSGSGKLGPFEAEPGALIEVRDVGIDASGNRVAVKSMLRTLEDSVPAVPNEIGILLMSQQAVWQGVQTAPIEDQPPTETEPPADSEPEPEAQVEDLAPEVTDEPDAPAPTDDVPPGDERSE